MTGRPAAFSALALASTASVADSEIADTRAETLVGMGSILAPGGQCPAAIYSGGRTAGSARTPTRADRRPAGPRGSTRGGIGRTLLEPAAELSYAAACPTAYCVCRE